ncbi:hypothetical protein HKX17_07660 [Sulfitobacter sp. KE34]|uniref:hypothetical protein n=1 Tax=unclassified Sulfitobacter TaxID=196795 RepID=UPI0023E33316|nr:MULTISPECIES: hypothetical protein [unclassified Sulfitobacter]MDF3350038.1 hypothetical protein [Sulfitobacter sp. KE12]MDF3353710.1 hypothetical protein [Sulfitobacter sp. KE27]MDF3357358.1 hypothetical protein [Sulfitobacter sp. KE33]MDF3364782.1 hypothetical protein [Sulfitobacter sp. Ks34]MDF3368390.1 hypothetical protein [Sulfitobacter sp. Ks43]
MASFFREKLANWLVKLSGLFSFVLVGRVQADGEKCLGRVYVISNYLNALDTRRLKKQLREASDENLDILAFEAELRQISCCEANFTLERQGRATVEIVSNEDASASLGQLLANQIFYFLKDISHVHQHHDPKHDAITELTIRNPSKSSEQWIADTQHALYRAIIRYKRFRNEKALFRASGILAYANAFYTSYVSGSTVSKTYHGDDLAESLSVTRAEIQHFDQKRLSRIETFRNFFFALFGLVLSVSYLARLGNFPKVEVHPAVAWMAETLAAYPFHAVAITGLASLFWAVATHRIDPANSEIVRWAIRCSQGFRLRYFMLSNIVITVLLSGACYILLLSWG